MGMMTPDMMDRGSGSGVMGPAMMRMMLTLMDTDGDGTVSLSEFQAAHERMFKAMDADKDGRLTLREVQAFFQGQGETMQPMTRPAQPNSNPATAPETRPTESNPAQ
jgi:hypothetical protein